MQSKGTNFGTKSITVLLMSLTLAASCTRTGGGSSCAGWTPITLDRSSIDGLTERDAQLILAHNEFGVVRGCW